MSCCLQYLGQLFIPAIQEASSEIALLASTLQKPFFASPANLMSPLQPDQEIVELKHALQWWQLLLQQGPVYEAKVPNQDGCRTI